MTDSKWWKYVQQIAGQVPNAEIADRVRIDPSHITRWKKDASRPDITFVVKFARAYGRPPVEAIAAMDWITDQEAAIREVKIGLDDLTTEQLLAEALRRVAAHPR